MEDWHKKKSDELDFLLRDHFIQQQHKHQRLESSLRGLRCENETLRGTVQFLTSELDACRESLRALKSDSQTAQLHEQALAVRRQQLFQSTENDLLQRKREVEQAEAGLQQRLSAVLAKEKDVDRLVAAYNEKQTTIDAALSLAQNQVQADLQRAQLVRQRAEVAAQEAYTTLAHEQAQLRTLNAKLCIQGALADLTGEETTHRLHLEATYMDEQRQLRAQYHGTLTQRLLQLAHNCTLSERELMRQRELVALKERELSVRLRLEHDTLRERMDQQTRDREDFQLQCQGIICRLKGLTSDLAPSIGHSQQILDHLAAVQEALDTLYLDCTLPPKQ